MLRFAVPASITLLLAVSSCRTGPTGGSGEDGNRTEGAGELTARRGSFDYPEAKKGPVVETLHGIEVADPYRWLEDPDSPERHGWIEAQNELSGAFLDRIPERKAIRERLESLWDYDKYDLPFQEGGRYFFTRKEGLQNQSVLYTAETRDGEPRVLLDENRLSEDGTTSVSQYAVDRSGKLLAYSISEAGSDWRAVRVRNVETGEDLDDVVRWVKFSRIAWSHDGRGFYYSRYDAPGEGSPLQQPNEYQKLYFHRLGTSQEEDRLVYEREDHKTWGFGARVTDDGRYLIIHVWDGTSPKNGIFYRDIQRDGEIVELMNDFDAAYDYIHNEGPLFYFFTDLDAPRGRIVAVHIDQPDSWSEIVPEGKATLENVRAVGGGLVAHYLEHARSRLEILTLTGEVEKEVELPAMGSVLGLRGDFSDREMFYAFSSFTFPTAIYRYSFSDDDSAVFRRPDVDFEPDGFEIRQVFYQSKDGTRVPMFIAHQKGLDLDGQNPTYLYGYGGFNISLTPSFSVPNLVWMEMGGVYAMPNLRGGGEYGEEWHQAGTRSRKQNVFDDFIAAAEFLIAEGYTSKEKLAIGGRSNGGLLVGAAITQQPDLFAASLPMVGVLDMLRFHKFTIGAAWVSDYGSPDDPEDFKALYAYSPYHNVRNGRRYPATFITTADHDDRVVPAHSYKFAARLQEAQAGPAPILIQIDTKTGHGAGKPTAKLIEEWTDNWSFLVHVLDMDLPGSFLRKASVSGRF